MSNFTGPRIEPSGYFEEGPEYSRYNGSIDRSAPDVVFTAVDSSNPLLAKLARLTTLAAGDVAAIEELWNGGTPVSGGQVLIRRGEAPGYVFLVVNGMAYRSKTLAGGQRQILGYLIPGDLCGIGCSATDRPDHDVRLLDKAGVKRFEHSAFTDLTMRFPAISRALELAMLAEGAILREWLLNIGQRNSLQRLSHLFCEMSARMVAVGQVDDEGSFSLPLNQTVLADTIGLTPVHINRTLQRLRGLGLIEMRHGRLTILEPARLAALAEFDANYLNIMRCDE